MQVEKEETHRECELIRVEDQGYVRQIRGEAQALASD